MFRCHSSCRSVGQHEEHGPSIFVSDRESFCILYTKSSAGSELRFCAAHPEWLENGELTQTATSLLP
jgi:hypothetical protein